MTEQELQRELERMREAGLKPLLCDMAVPLVDVPVLAGQPSEAGDSTDSRYVMLPRELVGRHPVFLIEVEGDSMTQAGITAGDVLEVQMETQANDGDIVVAEVDGAYTVKTLFTDDEGLLWLVPQNDSYDPILLTGHLWRIIGKVIGLRKATPRISFNNCARAVQRLRQRKTSPQAPQSPPAPQNLIFKHFSNRRRIDFAAIRDQLERIVVRQMKYRYEWYAAYRVLMDLGLLDELQLSKFALQMQAWFPEAPIQCTSDSLGEYAVGHTGKAFTLWNSEQFRQEIRKGQSATGFNTLYHRCEELRAALFPLPTLELGLPF